MSEDASDQAHAVPKQTTPTWEMELLVSGATVFALMQLPELIDRAYFRVVNLSPEDYAGLLLPLWMYSKLATIALVVTFVAHLCLRGYWVALVGMNSVYPGGIRWENLRRDNMAFRNIREELPSIEATIEHADNRATRVFATGFGLAMLMVKLSVIAMSMLATCIAVDMMLGSGHARIVFLALTCVVFLPLVLATMIDRRIGHRLAPTHPLQRFQARVLAGYARIGMGTRSNPLIAIFISNEGPRKAMSVLLACMLPIIALLLAQNAMLKGELQLDALAGLETDNPYSGATSPNAFYADAGRDRASKRPLPYIPARVAAGPYLPLFVPFIPRLHGPALASACPSAKATGDRLRCLARLSAIRIDGVAQAIDFQASTDPESGQPGMLAMLPVGALPSGRHELSLGEPAHASFDPAHPGRRYVIPFWK